MWVEAVKKAGTTDPDAVIDAIIGVAVPNLTGGFSAMMPNHHITKPVLIGEIQGNGQFDIVWQTPGLVVGDEWSRLPAGLQGPDRRLAQADDLRQLQRRHRQVRRQGQVGPDAHQLTGAGRLSSRPVLISGLILKPCFSCVCSRCCCRRWPRLLIAGAALAADLPALVGNLTTGSFGDRETAIGALAASGEPRAAPILEALARRPALCPQVRQARAHRQARRQPARPDRGDLRQAGRQRHPKPSSTASGSTTGCAASSRRPSAR